MTADQIKDAEFPRPDPQVSSLTSRQERAKKILVPEPKIGIRGIVLPEDLFDFVCERIEAAHKPAGEVIGAMLRRQLDLMKEQRTGSKIILESPDGKIEEVVFRMLPKNVIPLKAR